MLLLNFQIFYKWQYESLTCSVLYFVDDLFYAYLVSYLKCRSNGHVGIFYVDKLVLFLKDMV